MSVEIKIVDVPPDMPKNKVSPIALAEHVYCEFKQYMTYADDIEGKCAFGEYILALHIHAARDFYFKFAQAMYDALKGVKGKKKMLWFGDMDDYVTLIVDKPEKKVFHFRNTCSCADVVQWIFVWDTGGLKHEIHVREINEKSDYPKAEYPKKLGLRFYKDRDYIIDYVAKHHMTKLGGVYGDIRDKGYVISYERYEIDEPLNAKANQAIVNLNAHGKDMFHIHHYYGVHSNFTFTLQCIYRDLQDKKNLDKKQKGE